MGVEPGAQVFEWREGAGSGRGVRLLGPDYLGALVDLSCCSRVPETSDIAISI